MAHIPDGFLSAPVLAGSAAASAGVLAVAARRSSAKLRERQAPLLGAVTAFVFAAQMFNFPLGAGTSAHLLGGVLVAAMAGPWVGMLVLFSVVLVQALLFQDGGIAALGANTLNLAVIGAGGGWLLYRWLHALLGDGPRRRLAAAGVAAYLSAALTGSAVALELAASRTVPLGPALAVVGGGHLLVGFAEAALTVAILGMVLRARPEMASGMSPPSRVLRHWTLGVTGAALAVAVAAGYVASRRPDALESAVGRLGLGSSAAPVMEPVAGAVARPGGPWFAAGIGVTATFFLAWLVFRIVMSRRRS